MCFDSIGKLRKQVIQMYDATNRVTSIFFPLNKIFNKNNLQDYNLKNVSIE